MRVYKAMEPTSKLLAQNRSTDGHFYQEGSYYKTVKLNMEKFPDLPNAG